MGEVWILGHKCERCNHEWPKKKDVNGPNGYKEAPVICPKCRSPYWQRPKHVEQNSAASSTDTSQETNVVSTTDADQTA